MISWWQMAACHIALSRATFTPWIYLLSQRYDSGVDWHSRWDTKVNQKQFLWKPKLNEKINDQWECVSGETARPPSIIFSINTYTSSIYWFLNCNWRFPLQGNRVGKPLSLYFILHMNPTVCPSLSVYCEHAAGKLSNMLLLPMEMVRINLVQEEDFKAMPGSGWYHNTIHW